MSEERTLPAPGFPGYVVSSDGRVISHLRGWPHPLSTKKPAGYPAVSLCRNGRIVSRTVHSLVAEAFLGPRPDGMVVRHLDGDEGNPRLSNLAYGTHADNEADKERHGRRIRGGDVYGSILTADEVLEIRRLYAAGATQAELRRRFPMHATSMHNAIHGFSWKHLPTPDYSNRPRRRPGGPGWRPAAKLSERQVREIRGRLAAKHTLRRIAADFGIGTSTVRRIASGEAWRSA